MQELKQTIYSNIINALDSGKNVVLAWDGEAYSSLIWWLIKVDLNRDIKCVFIDDENQAPSLYSHIADIKMRKKLDVEMIRVPKGKTQEELLKLPQKYDLVITGKPVGGCYCPFPADDQKVWNLMKTLGVPFWSGKKKRHI